MRDARLILVAVEGAVTEPWYFCEDLMILLFLVAVASAEPTAFALAELLNLPTPVLVGKDPLASFVPDLQYGVESAETQAELDRLCHLPPIRRCYATALGKRPAWAVAVALGVDLNADGTVVPSVYGTQAVAGLEAGWTAYPAFDACIVTAARELKTTLPATHVQVMATFRPIVELTEITPEMNVIGFGGE